MHWTVFAKRTGRTVLALALSCGPLGCALTPARVVLKGDPAGVTLEGGAGREVVVFPATDARSETARCGVKRNTYGAETANAFCKPEASTWLVELVLRGLNQAGFRPVTLLTAQTPDPLRLRLRLERLFIDPDPGFTTVTLTADVHVGVTADTASGLVATRSFFVQVEESTAFVTDGSYQSVMDRATNALIARVVAAVVELADRHPAIGVPATRRGDAAPAVSLLVEEER
jgi:hypothetical protein